MSAVAGKRWIQWKLGLVVAIVLLVLAYEFAYTPTRTVAVVNDLGNSIDVSGCTSDGVIVISVGGSATVDALRGRDDTCNVYADSGGYLGCLPVPRSESVVLASRLRPFIKDASC